MVEKLLLTVSSAKNKMPFQEIKRTTDLQSLEQA
jgi:hypothetical protein